MRLVLLAALLLTTPSYAGDWDDYWGPGGTYEREQQENDKFERTLSATIQKSIRQGNSAVYLDSKGRPYVAPANNGKSGPNASGNSIRWNSLPKADTRSFTDKVAQARGETWSSNRGSGGGSNSVSWF